MSLSSAAVSHCDDVLPSVYVLTSGKLQDQRLVESGNGQEVEAVHALYRWEAGLLDATLHHASFPIDQLKLRKPQQIPGMIYAFFGTLPRYLVVLTEEGRKLQGLEVMGQQDRFDRLTRALWRVVHDLPPTSRLK